MTEDVQTGMTKAWHRRREMTLAEYTDELLLKTKRVGDCLLHQGAVDQQGYAKGYFRGKKVRAHRLVLAVKCGDQPGAWASHDCDNRACLNPEHLRWRTAKETIGRSASRMRQPSQRLNPEKVRIIRRTTDPKDHPELAARYGVTRKAIRDVISGRTWRWVT